MTLLVCSTKKWEQSNFESYTKKKKTHWSHENFTHAAGTKTCLAADQNIKQSNRDNTHHALLNNALVCPINSGTAWEIEFSSLYSCMEVAFSSVMFLFMMMNYYNGDIMGIGAK